jgi:ribonuclease-3
VSDFSLSEIGRMMGLGNYILLGRNERSSGGDRKKSNIANALEALIAAAFLDKGLEDAQKIVVNLLRGQIENASAEDFIIDYKSALQEICQKSKWGLPFYRVANEMGPKHKRIFLVEVRIKGQRYGSGRGLSKKEAEQNAAKETLEKINGKPAQQNRPKQEPLPVPPAKEVKKAKGIGNMFFKLIKPRKKQ